MGKAVRAILQTIKIVKMPVIVNSKVIILLYDFGNSLVAHSVKNLPVLQETRLQSLDWEDPLEKEIATHSSILA